MSFVTVFVLMFVVGSLVAFPFAGKSKLAAICFGISCLLSAGLFVFGFLASFEPSETGNNLGWKILYGTLFLAAVAGIIKAIATIFSRPNHVDS